MPICRYFLFVWRRRDDGFTVATIQVCLTIFIFIFEMIKEALQRLVQTLEAGRIPMGIVVIHEESCASHHLKHCALELNIPMTVSFTGLSRAYILGSLFPWRRKMIPDLVQSGSRNPNIQVVQLLVARLHRLGGAAVGQDMIHKLAPDEYKKYHRYLLRSYGTGMLCTKESAICGQGRLFCMCLSAKD
ncbi:hypothetical protein OROGR_020369 [Orobanche gracilis]